MLVRDLSDIRTHRSCPYTFNGFHGTDLIALASTRRPCDETHGDESWDYSWKAPFLLAGRLFEYIRLGEKPPNREARHYTFAVTARLHCEIQKLFIARRSGINSFPDSIENTQNVQRIAICIVKIAVMINTILQNISVMSIVNLNHFLILLYFIYFKTDAINKFSIVIFFAKR